jgi:hypothetical protein
VLPAPAVPAAVDHAPAKTKRRVRLALFAALFPLVLTACSTNSGPKSYDDKNGAVKTNFVNSCNDANPDKKDIADAQTFCECTYEAIKTSFTFDEFKALDEKLRNALDNKDTAPKNADDIANLDTRYATAVKSCVTTGPSAPATNPTTTVATTTTTK